MKKRVVILCILGYLLGLFGCRIAEKENAVSAGFGESRAEKEVGGEEEAGVDRFPRLEEVLSREVPDLKHVEYQIETDDPWFGEGHKIAYSPQGYYFFSEDGYLKFWDKETKQVVYVCTKLNCNHADETCDACYDMRDYRTEQGIWYQDGYLYFMGSEGSFSEYHLLRMLPDGTEQEDLGILFTLEGEEHEVLKSAVTHRGYFYFTLTNESSKKENAVIYRCALEPGIKVEEYYLYPGAEASVGRLKGYGDGLFFQIGHYLDAGLTEWQGGICYLDSDRKLSLLTGNSPHDYTIAEGRLIYSTAEGIYSYDWESGEKELFYDTGLVGYLSCDGSYLWWDDWIGVAIDDTVASDTRRIYQMDLEGKVLNQWNIPFRDSRFCLFGDADYLFMEWYEFYQEGSFEKMVPYYQAFDKKTGAWIPLETPEEVRKRMGTLE